MDWLQRYNNPQFSQGTLGQTRNLTVLVTLYAIFSTTATNHNRHDSISILDVMHFTLHTPCPCKRKENAHLAKVQNVVAQTKNATTVSQHWYWIIPRTCNKIKVNQEHATAVKNTVTTN
jgi:hypothetical protein